jgi:hypothetical protein
MSGRSKMIAGLRAPRRPRACPTKSLQEQGSALLVVFVFAAFVAIMLYREMPVALFEAQRQKEQVLVDRGHEYIRAVQLFYRKNRTFPASIEQLQNTNRIRFLRRKYTDPFTGKDDWRLLHAGGPNGMLIDSKVNPLKTGDKNQNGNASSSGANSDSTTANNETAAAATPPGMDGTFGAGPTSRMPRRPPAVAANGGTGAGGPVNGDDTNNGTPSSATLEDDPSAPLIPRRDAVTSANPAGAGDQPAGVAPPNNANGVGQDASSQPSGTGRGQSQNPMRAIGNLLNGGANLPQARQQGTFGQSGQIAGGSLAGVASKAEGHSIKLVNEQHNYSLWEFYYDPSKDTGQGAANAQNAGANQSLNQSLNQRTATQTGVQQQQNGAQQQNAVQQQNPPANPNGFAPEPSTEMPPEQNAPQGREPGDNGTPQPQPEPEPEPEQ